MINMLLVMCGCLMMMLLSREIRPMSGVVLKETPAGGRAFNGFFLSGKSVLPMYPSFRSFLETHWPFNFLSDSCFKSM